MKTCLREPIPEIDLAADLLKLAVKAHLLGRRDVAGALFRQADIKAVWDWTDSVWGKNSDHNRVQFDPDAPPKLPDALRPRPSAPTSMTKSLVHQRDGYRCRFCGIPVIRSVIRQAVARSYPEAVAWGRTNATQHAAFQCMWAQYDHVVPHARGGTSDMANIVLTCAACNFGRMDNTLAQMGLSDPRLRPPIQSEWSGLEEFLAMR